MGADESGPEVRAEPFGQAAIRPTPDSPVSEEQRGKTVRTDEQTSDSERAREGDKLRLGSDLVTYVLRRVVPVPVPFPVLPASRCHRNSGDDHRRVLRNQYVVRRVDWFVKQKKRKEQKAIRRDGHCTMFFLFNMLAPSEGTVRLLSGSFYTAFLCSYV